MFFLIVFFVNCISKLKTQTSISKLTLVLHLTRSMNLTRPTKLIFYLCTSMFATNNGLKNTRYIVLILSPPTRQTTSDKMCTVWLRMDPSVLSVTKNIYIFTFFFCQLKCINISKPRGFNTRRGRNKRVQLSLGNQLQHCTLAQQRK